MRFLFVAVLFACKQAFSAHGQSLHKDSELESRSNGVGEINDGTLNAKKGKLEGKESLGPPRFETSGKGEDIRMLQRFRNHNPLGKLERPPGLRNKNNLADFLSKIPPKKSTADAGNKAKTLADLKTQKASKKSTSNTNSKATKKSQKFKSKTKSNDRDTKKSGKRSKKIRKSKSRETTPAPTLSHNPSTTPTQADSPSPTNRGEHSFTPSSSPTSLSSTSPSNQDEFVEMQQGNTFPAVDGQTMNMRSQFGANPNNVVCGAIQAVLAHPTNPDICFAGATNGGVWRTFSCTATQPIWVPLMDGEDSLSVGDMVFDQTDPTGNTILVAIGTRSSFDQSGGPAIGLLHTTNALGPRPVWRVLDNAAGDVNFRTDEVKFDAAVAHGNIMMAAAYTSRDSICPQVGIFRSVDAGITWDNVLEGQGLAIASDPNDPNRFYATLDFTGLCSDNFLESNGVFTSDDSGLTWSHVAQIPDGEIGTGELSNAKISVSADGSRVWSALLKNGFMYDVSYSDNQGTSWENMDLIQTQQADGKVDGLMTRLWGSLHFSLLSSPSNRNEVYIGGDHQGGCESTNCARFWPNFVGATDFTGRLFRGDASVVPNGAIPSSQWEHMTDSDSVNEIPQGGTLSGSAPHADSRDMEVRADGHILEADNGGITVRTQPGSNTGDWFGVCGNMQVFETHNVAYEPIRRTVIFGNQDNGSIAGTLGSPGTFLTVLAGDGNDCMIDFRSDPDFLYLYYGTQRFSAFRRIKMEKNTGIIRVVSSLALPEAGGFLSVAALNPNDQSVFSVASGAGPNIMFTEDRGDTFQFAPFPNISNDPQQGPTIATAMAWSADGTHLCAAHYSTVVWQSVYCCTLTGSCEGGGSPGLYINQLAIDPNHSNHIFAATISGVRDYSSPGVYWSKDQGENWKDMNVPGSLLATAALGGAVAYISQGPVQTVAVGTSNGVLVADGIIGSGHSWRLLAEGLPKVPVLDMQYEAEDDTLVVATLGRGVWYLDSASSGVLNPSEWRPLGSGIGLEEVVPIAPEPIPPTNTITVGKRPRKQSLKELMRFRGDLL